MQKGLKGIISLPGDKSISHRALMLAAIPSGRSKIYNLARSLDVESTVRCLKALGVEINFVDGVCVVEGNGFRNFKKPASPLDCGNSGTTLRLLLGLLSGSNVTCTLTGDSSLKRRPIRRVVDPLNGMGAVFELLANRDGCPVIVHGKKLKGISQTLKVPSAQVKTAILLAGLQAEGETKLVEPIKTRDHTERMLKYLGVAINRSENTIRLSPPVLILPFEIKIPADPSTSSFPIVGAALMPGSELVITKVLLNRYRTGFIRILRKMEANIRFLNVTSYCGETIADIAISYAKLRAVHVPSEMSPSYIDEAPILALAASQASGMSRFCGLKELRLKESDRLANTALILSKMGANATVEGDDLCVEGPAVLRPYKGDCFGDHRLAMMIEIANLICVGETNHQYEKEIRISYKDFYETIRKVTA